MHIFFKIKGNPAWQHIVYSVSKAPGFCAYSLIHGFSGPSIYPRDEIDEGIGTHVIMKGSPFKSKEEWAEALMISVIRLVPGRRLMICDERNGNMDQHLVPYIPWEFKAVNYRGSAVHCTFEKGKAYINPNTNHEVREDTIWISKEKVR